MIERVSPVGTAKLSEDGRHRFVLTRAPLPVGPDTVGPNRFVVIGLNPSTADESTNDNTIRRVSAFASREGARELVMLNLYSFRATHPIDLFRSNDRMRMPDTDEVIREQLADPSARIVCAWGAVGGEYPNRVERMIEMIREAGHRSYCFGETAAGHPRHPLYLAKDTPLVLYER